MSRRADFLQLVVLALHRETSASFALGLLAQAQAIPEEAIPKGDLGKVVVEYVIWLYESRRGAGSVMDPATGLFKEGPSSAEPEWHKEWRENAEGPHVRVSVADGEHYDAWWQELELSRVGDAESLKIPASCLPLLQIGAPASDALMLKRDADAFRAWVEATPAYEPTAPPFFFEDHEASR